MPDTLLTPERLAEIEVRANAATSGPWEAKDLSTIQPLICDLSGDGIALLTVRGPQNRTRKIADVCFIAHARQDVPDLIAEVRRLQTKVRQFETWAEGEGYTIHDAEPV